MSCQSTILERLGELQGLLGGLRAIMCVVGCYVQFWFDIYVQVMLFTTKVTMSN